jgi:hypothetical protein
LALVAGLCAAVSLAACSETADPVGVVQPAAAPAQTTPIGVPRITFDTTAHDFGSIVDTEEYQAVFSFTNTGTAKLVISTVKAGCGCTVPTLNKSEILPGESSTIDVVFNPSGKVGIQRKTISVISNAQPNNVTHLAIQGNISPLVRIDNMFLEFGVMQLGQQHQRRVSVSYADPDLAITNVTVSSPYVSARVVETRRPNPAGGEWPYQAVFEVTLGSDAPWGVLLQAKLTFTATGRPTANPDPRSAEYMIWTNAVLFGDISADPVMLFPQGSVGRGRPVTCSTLLTRGSAAPFSVIDVRISESTAPRLRVRAEPVSPSSWRVVLEGVAPPMGTTAKGILVVQTDVPGERNLSLHFSMFLQ